MKYISSKEKSFLVTCILTNGTTLNIVMKLIAASLGVKLTKIQIKLKVFLQLKEFKSERKIYSSAGINLSLPNTQLHF